MNKKFFVSFKSLRCFIPGKLRSISSCVKIAYIGCLGIILMGVLPRQCYETKFVNGYQEQDTWSLASRNLNRNILALKCDKINNLDNENHILINSHFCLKFSTNKEKSRSQYLAISKAQQYNFLYRDLSQFIFTLYNACLIYDLM